MDDFIEYFSVKLAIILCIIFIFGSFITYYFLISAPNKSKEQQLDLQKQEYQDKQTQQEINKAALKDCLSLANTEYTISWNEECQKNSINEQTENCTLPDWDTKMLQDKKNNAINNCLNQYSPR